MNQDFQYISSHGLAKMLLGMPDLPIFNVQGFQITIVAEHIFRPIPKMELTRSGSA